MALQGRQVLVVDDDPEMRTLLRRILESAGMVVAEADSVSQAFEVAQTASPHLVILDMRMPREAGFKFLERRLSHPTMKEVPVIVVSAISDNRVVFAAIGAGAADYLLKPFTSALLIQKIRKALLETDFKVVKFEPGKRPAGVLAVQAEITRVDETSFQIDSPVRLVPSSRISVKCEAFTRANLDSCLFQRSPAESKMGISGQYSSRVDVAGLDETLIKKLAKKKVPN